MVLISRVELKLAREDIIGHEEQLILYFFLLHIIFPQYDPKLLNIEVQILQWVHYLVVNGLVKQPLRVSLEAIPIGLTEFVVLLVIHVVLRMVLLQLPAL